MARPKRALSPLESAHVSFRAGDYSSALDEASRVVRGGGPHAQDASILIARIHLRTGASAAAVAALEPERPMRHNATAATLLGVAYCRLGDTATGVPMIESAHRRSAGAADGAESAYYRAWVAYAERDLDVAERWIAWSLDDAAGVVYARGLALSGWISEAREDYRGAVRAHRLALGKLRNGDERDDELAARIVHTLAFFAAELPDQSLAEFVRAQGAATVWSPSAALHRFQTSVHLAIARVNEGLPEAALDELDQPEVASPAQPALEAQARLESADVYRMLGEPVAARRALRAAAQALRRVDWSSVSIDDSTALLESACLAARLDPTTASEWIVRYAAIPKHDPGWWALTGDARVHALELHARGLVDVAIAERRRGLERLREAAAIWRRIGYDRRAAYAAADLLAAGDVSNAELFAGLSAKAPRHPLLRGARDVPEKSRSVEPAGPALLPSEARVLEALCAGISVKEMARSWGRSPFTIRNQLKRLFAKFGVSSSAALVAKALRPGLPPTGARPPERSAPERPRRARPQP
jgi:DNA-binding CsgD family transcriptional regulator